ncbi:MAG: GFA family protein [Thiohalocapsa sp.]|jgi:hypothetical protein
MTTRHEGGCHCGAVRYAFGEAPEFTFYCHCNDCQKTTGSPFSIELMLRDETFSVTGELGTYVVEGDSGKPVTRSFCTKCGSGVYLECASDPGYVFVKVGTLDDASWVEPQMHIYTASKQPWLELADDLPAYEKAPPE